MDSYQLRRGSFKNLTLRVTPPDGTLVVSAPWFVPRVLVDRFVAQKAAWIAQKRKMLATMPLSVDGALSSIQVWGQAYRLRVESPGRLPRVVCDPDAGLVVLRVPPTWAPPQHRRILEAWEKQRVTEALTRLVPAWATRMGLTVERWSVKRLRSRWGSCQPATRSLVFNARLAAFPPQCLEYVVVHELVHLIEASHNARFHALVEGWFPGSAAARQRLRSASVPTDSGVFPDPLASSGVEMAP